MSIDFELYVSKTCKKYYKDNKKSAPTQCVKQKPLHIHTKHHQTLNFKLVKQMNEEREEVIWCLSSYSEHYHSTLVFGWLSDFLLARFYCYSNVCVCVSVFALNDRPSHPIFFLVFIQYVNVEEWNIASHLHLIAISMTEKYAFEPSRVSVKRSAKDLNFQLKFLTLKIQQQAIHINIRLDYHEYSS